MVKFMFTIEDFIINVFCCVDDLLQEVSKSSPLCPLRRKGFAPALNDSEIITMEIIGEYQGIDTDQGIWKYFREHWQPFFPDIKSRSSFVRRAANLSQYKEILQKRLAEKMGGFTEDVHLIDGIPIPLCCITRAPRCRSFRGEADYSYCASKKQKYYGFHGHLMISANGIITGFSLTPANVDERDALWDLVPQIQGLLIGDKGYISSFLKTELRPLGIQLETALRENMKDNRPKQWVKMLVRVRRLIETVIGQLAGRFHFEKIWARDMWHLMSRINRKLLAHTVCYWLNRHNPEPLQINSLVSA
jgi:hypothetical protein